MDLLQQTSVPVQSQAAFVLTLSLLCLCYAPQGHRIVMMPEFNSWIYKKKMKQKRERLDQHK